MNYQEVHNLFETETIKYPSEAHLNKILERHHATSADHSASLARYHRRDAQAAESRGDYAAAQMHNKDAEKREFSSKLHMTAAQKLRDGHADAREAHKIANEHDEVHHNVRHPNYEGEYAYNGNRFNNEGYFKG